MAKKQSCRTSLSAADLGVILRAESADPFGILGMHRVEGGVAVRVFMPEARRVAVLAREARARYAAARVHAEGFFEALIPGRRELFAYELEVEDGQGRVQRRRDPYSFWPQLSDYDQHLFNEGTHARIHEHLGAHPREIDGVEGVYFAVWAPNARRVSVVGDFNAWDGRRHPMRVLGSSGIWELFAPHLGAGAAYKYEIRDGAGAVFLKSDPYAFAAEAPPRTASVVSESAALSWSDAEWMAARAQRNWLEEPVALYEVHPGSWRRVPEEHDRPLNFRELARELVPYVAQMGFSHLEFMAIAEHPFDASWGYQVTGYFAPSARFGPPEDFAYLVDCCHRHRIGVVIDWVPGHFPRDAHGLANFDGTQLYEHADPRQGAHPDWGTLVFNFGRCEVRSFLLSNALFWLERYHVDGLRVDAVASMLYLDYSRREGEWIPNAHGGRENLEAIHFLREMNTRVYARFPGVLTVAEESTAWPAVSRPTYVGGLGFGFKWNMGWMNDVLHYMSQDPVHRKYHQSDLSFGMLYFYHENFILPLSHDEVVHGKRSLLDKMPGDPWQKFANLRLLYTFMYGHPGKKLLFMGGEIGQWSEWDHRRSLDWHLLEHQSHRGVQLLLKDLNALYRGHAALHRGEMSPEGFFWIDCQDVENSIVAFGRRDPESGEVLIFAYNFTPVPRAGYRLGAPQAGYYREVLNSDAAAYGGSNMGLEGGVRSREIPAHGCAHSLELQLPPLGALVLKWCGQRAD